MDLQVIPDGGFTAAQVWACQAGCLAAIVFIIPGLPSSLRSDLCRQRLAALRTQAGSTEAGNGGTVCRMLPAAICMQSRLLSQCCDPQALPSCPTPWQTPPLGPNLARASASIGLLSLWSACKPMSATLLHVSRVLYMPALAIHVSHGSPIRLPCLPAVILWARCRPGLSWASAPSLLCRVETLPRPLAHGLWPCPGRRPCRSPRHPTCTRWAGCA